jgi:DNA polymerase
VNSANPSKKFKQLCDEASACKFCPRMADLPAVLGPGNGSITSDVVFIAEAPGRFGAGKTGIPFSGDRSGDNFEILLKHSGLTRKEVFITNAALCNPLENGNNSRPTTKEIRNCSYYLQAVLDIIQPKIIVTLGGVGLQAMNLLLQTKFQLKHDAAKWQKLKAPLKLLPLYHPSPRVTNWQRPLQQQKIDFNKITRALKKHRNSL